MAKYDVTRICGHVETVNIIGPGRDREWRLKNEEGKLCGECHQAKLNEENAKAAREAEKMGLPVLTGTEKQVSWAETVRVKAIERFGDAVREMRNPITKTNKQVAIDIFDYLVSTKTQASWWIDNRHMSGNDYILGETIKRNHEEYNKTLAEQSPAVVDAKAEATVRPSAPITETVAEIRPIDDSLEISFPERRDDFRDIAREKLKMRWNYDRNCWHRKLSFRTGGPIDRAAEAGHRLLAAGIPIRIYDPEIQRKAINSEYEHENPNWVAVRRGGKFDGWFLIMWDRKDDYYQAARKLPGSRWDNPTVVVPAEQFDAILDFAEQYGFSLSDGAKTLIDAMHQARESALVADVTAPVESEKVVTGRTPSKLDVPEAVDIDATLQDKD